MQANHIMEYDVDKSSARIDEILNVSNQEFIEKDSIPSRDTLTYKNGCYVNVTCLFIDIIGSSDMTDKHKRPTLAKIYRCFISECVAIIKSYDICKEININGDCVWGVFDTQNNIDKNTVFEIAGQLSSLITILNYKLYKKDYSEIKVGIGIDYGRALMVKAGYTDSSINDVVWMGDVVNSACHICNKAGRDGRKSLIITKSIYDSLTDKYKGFMNRYTSGGQVLYESNIHNIYMNDWYKENCK